MTLLRVKLEATKVAESGCMTASCLIDGRDLFHLVLPAAAIRKTTMLSAFIGEQWFRDL
jgi:hypothetical protein